MDSDPYGRSRFPPEATKQSSRWRKCAVNVASGFAMGASLGLTVGFLFGTLSALGPQNKGKRIQLIAQQSIQLGGVFGLFLAAGTVIRGGC